LPTRRLAEDLSMIRIGERKVTGGLVNLPVTW
jgi:hypothetical protein